MFRKLNAFKQFSAQSDDELGEQVRTSPRKQVEASSPSPLKDRQTSLLGSTVQISIEQSRLIRNVVYLRDVSVLETLGKDINQLTQRDVFQHENSVDVR